jgi:hypothetical protein
MQALEMQGMISRKVLSYENSLMGGKINVDAGFQQNGFQGVTGCLLQAISRFYHAPPDALVMEANALRDGVRMAAQVLICGRPRS